MNMYTTFRSDKRRTPDLYEVRFLSYEDVLRLRVGQRVNVIDRDSKIAEVKVSSIHTWKRKQDVRIGWKWGLYDYGAETVVPNEQQRFFVDVVGKCDPMQFPEFPFGR